MAWSAVRPAANVPWRIEPFDPGQIMLYRVVFGLVGMLAGLVLTPYVTTRPSRAIRTRLGRLSAETLFAAGQIERGDAVAHGDLNL